MNPFEFVIVIVVLSFIYKLVSGMIRHRQESPKADEPGRAELLKRLDEVEERVRVLERIVTDERFDLKKQFEELERERRPAANGGRAADHFEAGVGFADLNAFT
jgi:hypothetical protein